MRVIAIALFISNLFFAGNALVLRAQPALEGRVVDAHTGKPLRGANVFLSGTKIGTATNALGQYRLKKVPPGSYRLIVSMIGYGRTLVEVIVGRQETKRVDFELKAVIYEMPEIFVGNLDKKWEKHLKRFRNLFIGESKFADSVKILNPEVLRFESRWWGRFSAIALAPLKIENLALGYHITYYLDEFYHAGSRTRWDGDPFFTEMTPADSQQATYWMKNRRNAFYGSLRHFLLAMLQNRVKEEGFILYNIKQGVYGYSTQNRFRTSGQRFIRKRGNEELHKLNFFGRLKIIYTKIGENRRYLHWLNEYQRSPMGVQTSYLQLNEHPITIDANGEIIEPYGATRFGYFAFHRLADKTPREYRPKEYNQAVN
ncbi:MAG: carboxypeptidase-like regulatory domain-containing protein [Balneolaceae bacterium]|jgi:hypothetical protein